MPSIFTYSDLEHACDEVSETNDSERMYFYEYMQNIILAYAYEFEACLADITAQTVINACTHARNALPVEYYNDVTDFTRQVLHILGLSPNDYIELC